MTSTKFAFEKLPYWPRALNQQQAAAYLGVSVATFAKQQRAGAWPAPVQVLGCGRKLWNRKALAAAFDRISGLSTGTPDEENSHGRDRDSIKRRIDEFFGDQENPASGLPAGQG